MSNKKQDSSKPKRVGGGDFSAPPINSGAFSIILNSPYTPPNLQKLLPPLLINSYKIQSNYRHIQLKDLRYFRLLGFCFRKATRRSSASTTEFDEIHQEKLQRNRSQQSMAMQFFNRAYDPLFQQLESLALSEPSQFMSKDPAQISVDWRETPHAHIIQADLPGVKKEDVKLEIQNGVMEIRGKQAEEGEEVEGVTWHVMERPVHLSKGLRVRSVALPEDANVDEVKASVSHGVLTVNIPKKPVRKPRVKKVEIEDVSKEGIGHKIVKSLKGIVAPAKSK